MGRAEKRRRIAYQPGLDELSASWAQIYDAEQAGKAGLDADQHRRAAEDRELRRREAEAGPGPVTST